MLSKRRAKSAVFIILLLVIMSAKQADVVNENQEVNLGKDFTPAGNGAEGRFGMKIFEKKLKEG